ncbi:MAG: hypothetical protein LBU60_02675 [Clostridiales bacterium]|jgi:hypothetical protein|nr:hypothetical protein [Clostridiales bacterium]
MSVDEVKKCNLCGYEKANKQWLSLGFDWNKYCCDKCGFNYVLHNSVEEIDKPEKYKNKNSFTNSEMSEFCKLMDVENPKNKKEIRKRYNAIYNFLSDEPYYNGNYFWKFYYQNSDEVSEKPHINVKQLLDNYPKTSEEKTKKVLTNIVSKFPFGKSFVLNDLNTGMMFCETESCDDEIMAWINDFVTNKYLNCANGDITYGHKYSITRAGLSFLEGEKMDKDSISIQVNPTISPNISPQFSNVFNANVEIKIATVIDDISKVKELDDSEKQFLTKMMLEIENLKQGDKQTLWQKIKSAGEWVLKKGIESTVATMPYLLGVIK